MKEAKSLHGKAQVSSDKPGQKIEFLEVLEVLTRFT